MKSSNCSRAARLKIVDFVPLAGLKQLDFGGWDIFEDNAYEAAKNAQVLNPELLLKLKPSLEKITPMKAVFDRRYVTRIDGPNVKNKGRCGIKREP